MTRLLTLSFVIVAMAARARTNQQHLGTNGSRAKYGRNSPASEVRVHSDNTGTAYREVATHDAARHTSNWFEQWSERSTAAILPLKRTPPSRADRYGLP